MKKLSLRSGLLATTTICGAALSTMVGGALVATVATMLPATAQAQDYTSGAVTISVDDFSGAPVAGATVTLKSQAQGITKTLTTSASGSASATGLAPGEYDVIITAGGYDDYTSTATVVVSQSVGYTYTLNTTGATQTVVVKGKRVRQDFKKTTQGLSVDLTTLTSQQAIGRSVEAVTLLAPTAVNSTAFDEPSIGGGSAAENAFYINGLNVTNPDTFVGGASVPFDFYKTIDVQTSGYAAEFGRAAGGVVNATTKSGTNDFMFAVHGNFAPEALRADRFASDNTTSPVKYRKNDLNSLTVESGGALVKDKLFLYGLVQFNDNKSSFANTSSQYWEKDQDSDPFYGLKADWYITPSQHLELTYFDTTTTQKQTRYSYNGNAPDGRHHIIDPVTKEEIGVEDATIGDKIGEAVQKNGGPSWVAKYTGNITDWLTVSAAYGDTKDTNDFSAADTSQPYAVSYNPVTGRYDRISVLQPYSDATSQDDWERKFYRGDVDIRFEGLGRHHVRFGFDHEDVSMDKTQQLPGAQPIRYYLFPDYSYGFIIYEHMGGHVSGKATSYYIQDSWDVTSTLNLQIGLRNDDFLQYNLSGEKYMDLTGNLAPRLGFSWKPSEDSKWRFTGSYGEYFIPPAMNMGFRGKDLYFAEGYDMPEGGYTYDPTTGLPIDMGTPNGAIYGDSVCPDSDVESAPVKLINGGNYCAVFGNGTQEPAAQKAAVGLKATREKEITLGANYRANDMWTLGLSYVHRSLDRVSEDTDFAPQINAYCETVATEAELEDGACQYSNEYHVWNPGSTVTINIFPQNALPDGTTQLTFTDLPFAKPKRDYDALTFDFNRAFDGKWGLQGSYTWSKSYGNYEGTVLTIGDGTSQEDAGSTILYDYPGLQENSTGYLANNHDHQFKLMGTYAVTPDFLVGANLQVISPAYFSCLGTYPDITNPASDYGAVSHFCYPESGGMTSDPSPMGKGGKSDWIKTVDLHLSYTLPHEVIMGGKLVLRADIFNLFNDKEVLARDMTSDLGQFNKSGPNLFTHNSNFGEPVSFNSSRYMRIGFDITY